MTTLELALIVDNPFRDLPGLVLTASGLCKHGAVVHLVPMNLMDTELRRIAPDAVLLNYLRPTNEHVAQRLADADVGIFVLDTEAGVIASVESYGNSLARDPSTRAAVHTFMTWGRRLSHAVVERGWFRSDQVVATGCPRFDFYAPAWRDAALSASPYADIGRAPYVLVNGNFPTANPRFQSPDQERRMLIDRFGWAEDSVDAFRATQRMTLEGLVRATNELADRFPQVTFVYRPHPFERTDTYVDLLSARPNIYLSKEGSVDGWILRAAAVIQRSCTTAVEAAISHRPALSPAWLPTAAIMEVAERVSVDCWNINDLADHVNAAVSGSIKTSTEVEAALRQVIPDWFLAIDGESHLRVARVLLDGTPIHSRREHRRRCNTLDLASGDWSTRAKRLAKRHLPAVVRTLGPGKAHARAGRREKRFGVTDVERLLSAIRDPDARTRTTIRARRRWHSITLEPRS